MIAWSEVRDGVHCVVTDRAGGASTGVWDGLNLGGHVGDDPVAVEANRSRLCAELGVDRAALVLMDQVHGADVAVLDAPPVTPPRVDALVTRAPGLVLGVLVADCTPVVLTDAAGAAHAVVHAGRPGMMAGVIPATVRALQGLGARALHAVVGPSVCSRCYEVPAAMRAEAAAVTPAAAAVSWTGTPAIDVAAGVVDQLHALAVEVTWLPGCTREDPRWYSHRRDGVTGRFGAFAWRPAS